VKFFTTKTLRHKDLRHVATKQAGGFVSRFLRNFITSSEELFDSDESLFVAALQHQVKS